MVLRSERILAFVRSILFVCEILCKCVVFCVWSDFFFFKVTTKLKAIHNNYSDSSHSMSFKSSYIHKHALTHNISIYKYLLDGFTGSGQILKSTETWPHFCLNWRWYFDQSTKPFCVLPVLSYCPLYGSNFILIVIVCARFFVVVVVNSRFLNINGELLFVAHVKRYPSSKLVRYSSHRYNTHTGISFRFIKYSSLS